MRMVLAALPNAKMQTHAAADTTNMIAIDTKKRMMGRREKSIPDSATMAKSLTNGSLDETMADPRMAANSRQGMTALMGLTLLPNTTKNEWNLGSGLQKKISNTFILKKIETFLHLFTRQQKVQLR